MEIWCCGCNATVSARLTTGKEIYRHRPDLYDLPFWKCDDCKNFVGCHHKTADRTRPLGCIPTAELKSARQSIHAALDPLWQDGTYPRRKLYQMVAERLGISEYHTAEIRTLKEAQNVIDFARELRTKKSRVALCTYEPPDCLKRRGRIGSGPIS